MKINRIDIISIPVSDQDAAKIFYRDILGFDVLWDDPMGPNQQWVQLAPPGAETSITLVTWFEKMQPGSVHGMVLDTEDISSAYEKLKSSGIAVSDIEHAPWASFATFSDPDGNGWIIQQATVQT